MADWPGWVWVLVAEVGHWVTIAPLLACAILAHRKQHVPPDMWLLSAAFGVSFVADQVALRFALAGQENLWLALLWAPLQFGLFGAVLSPRRATRWSIGVGLGLLSLVAARTGTIPQATAALHIAGGVMMATLVWPSATHLGFRWPVTIYGLLTLPGLLVFTAAGPGSTWYAGWTAYHLARVVALLWMVRIVLCPDRRGKEAEDGPGIVDITNQRRRADWVTGLHRGGTVAEARRR